MHLGMTEKSRQMPLAKLIHSMFACYPMVFRSPSQDDARAKAKQWKAALEQEISDGEAESFCQSFMGIRMFDAVPPRPIHFAMIREHLNKAEMTLALRLDDHMHAQYMSLYLKEPYPRLVRILEYISLLEDLALSDAEVSGLVSQVTKEASWRTYPPTIFDLRSVAIRSRMGVGSSESEFMLFCEGKKTACGRLISRIVGATNLKMMSVERQQRIFKSIYQSCEEAGWDGLEGEWDFDALESDISNWPVDESAPSTEHTKRIFSGDNNV